MSRKLRFVPEGGALVEVTRRTIRGRSLLRPSQQLNSIFLGVLGRAQSRHPPCAAPMHPVIMGPVIRSFADQGTEDVFDGINSKEARATCPSSLWATAQRKLDQINRARDLSDLAVPPGNRLERLKGDRAGQHSIRINDQYRVCFSWKDGYADEVEITDYH